MEASLIAFLASIVFGALVVFTRGYHSRYTLDAISPSPRKIHTAPAPHIGGLAHGVNIVDGLNGLAGFTAPVLATTRWACEPSA